MKYLKKTAILVDGGFYRTRAIHADSSIGEMIALPEDVEKLNY